VGLLLLEQCAVGAVQHGNHGRVGLLRLELCPMGALARAELGGEPVERVVREGDRLAGAGRLAAS
jgi:hypothetical protein